MNSTSSTLARRTGLAAVVGATLCAGSIGAQLVHSVEDGSSIVELPFFLALIGTYAIGMGLLTAALVGLRALHRAEDASVGRAGRIGFRLAVAGTSLQVVFAAVMFVGALATRETVGAAFFLFALGFLSLIVGQILLALGLRRGRLVGKGWVVPLAGIAAAILAITTAADPYHDLGLFLYFGSWVVLGGVVLARSSGRPAVSSAASVSA